MNIASEASNQCRKPIFGSKITNVTFQNETFLAIFKHCDGVAFET